MSKKASQSSHAESNLPDAVQIDTCYGELDDPILGQEVSDQGCMFLAHVLVVVFFGHTGFTIGANRPLKQTPGFLA